MASHHRGGGGRGGPQNNPPAGHGGGRGGQYHRGRGRGHGGDGYGGRDGGGGRGRGYQAHQGGGGRGRGYQANQGDGGPGRGNQSYQGDGGGGGHYDGGGYQGGGGEGRGSGRGRQGGGGGGGGGRGRGRGHGQPTADLHQAAGPPLADRYAAEAAELQKKFQKMEIHRDEPTFPARPGVGTAGQRCLVRANHFFVGLTDKGLHQYDVKISPESTAPGVYRSVMSKLVSEHKQTHLGGRLPAYDGRKSLYTAGELPFESKDFDVILSDDKPGPSSSRLRMEKRFRVTIKHATLISLQQLRMLMAGVATDIPAQALQVLDVVFRDIVLTERSDMGYVLAGRSFFSPYLDRSDISLGIESWKGFYQSVRPTQLGLSLNIDMSSTAFIQDLPLIEFIKKILKKRTIDNYITDVEYMTMKKALRGVKIEVTHRANARRKYRIANLTQLSATNLRFQTSDGISKTVNDYFAEKHNLRLHYDFLPCLQVGTEQKPNYLPMEVCKIVLGQKYQKKLNDTQVSNMMRSTCQHPYDRESSIRQTVEHNRYNHTERANEFGIEVDYNPTSVEARVLPPPTLKYHDSGPERNCCPAGGQWNMRNKKVVNGARITNWLCVNFCHDLGEQNVRGFCAELVKMSRITGLDFADMRLPIFTNANPERIETDLPDFYQDMLDNELTGQRIDLLLALLPDKNGNLYGNVKRICETQIGLISQCCRRTHVIDKKAQYLANVAIKINAKAGGRNSVFADIRASLPVVSNKPTILFGADVTHPAALDDTAPSIASVVASQDWPEVTKYSGVVRAQGNREELIRGLEDIVKELLQAFERGSKQRPQQLIFYRDGVSEGQFKQVLEREIPEIEKAWKALYNEKPKITFIVVQKRNHTRLFPTNYDDNRLADRSGNVLPGTVVDSKICHPTEFDFYLVSHAGIKGTSRPTHYHVLRDDNNFTADGLQSLTNNLCYTYASCTRSVSIAPPAYYAHKLAYRARFYVPQGSDVASMCSGSAVPAKEFPKIKDELKRFMFYC